MWGRFLADPDDGSSPEVEAKPRNTFPRARARFGVRASTPRRTPSFPHDDAGNRPSDEGAEANQTSRIVTTTRTTTPTVTRTPLNSRCVGTEHTFAMNKSERDKTHFERAACGAANTTQIGFESNGAEIVCTFRKMAYNEGCA